MHNQQFVAKCVQPVADSAQDFQSKEVFHGEIIHGVIGVGDKGDGTALSFAQVAGGGVDLKMMLPGNCLDTLPGFLLDKRAVV